MGTIFGPPSVIIWGTGGHARVVADIVRQQRCYRLRGFIEDANPREHGSNFSGAPVLGGREVFGEMRSEGIDYLLVAVGNNAARQKLARLAQSAGFQLAVAVHPRSIIAPDVLIGAGTVIVAGAVVNPGARIGENVIVNTSATVGHDCQIADGAHIGPGAHLGGHATIGCATWIALGAMIIDGISIGAGSVIGAGAVVVRDIPSGVVAYGTPARVIRATGEGSGRKSNHH